MSGFRRRESDAEDGNGGAVEGEALGVKVRLRGYRLQDLIIIISAVIIPCVVGTSVLYVVNEWRLQNEVSRQRIVQQMSDEHKRMEANQKEQTAALKDQQEALEELVYITSLTLDERAKLKVEMPYSLRKKLRGDR